MNSITLKPEINELYALNEFILEEIGKKDVHVMLIVEEILVNIIDYSKTDFIIVNAEFMEPTLTIEFIDNGIEFNPLLKENPPLPDNIDEAQIGGLGIFLTKELVEDLDYHYIDGENHLIITMTVE